jgi:hypothetical protein
MPILIPTIVGAGAVPPGSTAVLGLDRYVDKSVEDFCEFHFGKIDDSENHCAHFVSHVLGLQVGTTCESLLDWAHTKANYKAGLKGKKGYTVRVNDLYNSLKVTGDWSDSVAAPCLVFTTPPHNFLNKERMRMGSFKNKHVGIYSGTHIYNYGNTLDKVRKDTPAEFLAHFRKIYGGTTVFRYGALPS